MPLRRSKPIQIEQPQRTVRGGVVERSRCGEGRLGAGSGRRVAGASEACSVELGVPLECAPARPQQSVREAQREALEAGQQCACADSRALRPARRTSPRSCAARRPAPCRAAADPVPGGRARRRSPRPGSRAPRGCPARRRDTAVPPPPGGAGSRGGPGDERGQIAAGLVNEGEPDALREALVSRPRRAPRIGRASASVVTIETSACGASTRAAAHM